MRSHRLRHDTHAALLGAPGHAPGNQLACMQCRTFFHIAGRAVHHHCLFIAFSRASAAAARRARMSSLPGAGRPALLVSPPPPAPPKRWPSPADADARSLSLREEEEWQRHASMPMCQMWRHACDTSTTSQSTDAACAHLCHRLQLLRVSSSELLHLDAIDKCLKRWHRAHAACRCNVLGWDMEGHTVSALCGVVCVAWRTAPQRYLGGHKSVPAAHLHLL